MVRGLGQGGTCGGGMGNHGQVWGKKSMGIHGKWEGQIQAGVGPGVGHCLGSPKAGKVCWEVAMGIQPGNHTRQVQGQKAGSWAGIEGKVQTRRIPQGKEGMAHRGRNQHTGRSCGRTGYGGIQ